MQSDQLITAFRNCLQNGDFEKGLRLSLGLLGQSPADARGLFATAYFHTQTGNAEKAAAFYLKAICVEPQSIDALLNLGSLRLRTGDPAKSYELFCRALSVAPHMDLSLHNAGCALHAMDRPAQAARFLSRALNVNPDSIHACISLGAIYSRGGDREKALVRFDRALQLDQTSFSAGIGRLAASLPVVYSDLSEIHETRSLYISGLERLSASLKLETRPEIEQAFDAIGHSLPFFLPYQGENDLIPQKIYGRMISRIVRAKHPEYAHCPSLPEVRDGVPLRIGFVSAYFYNHSNWKIPIRGWVKNLNRDKFELYGFHTGHRQDGCTEEAQGYFRRFHQGGRDFRSWCETIRGSALHALIYPEVGMDALTLKLAALRLAPVQAASWGHPQTTGLDSMDYFISSEMMETRAAEEFYTEKPITLPGTSFHYIPQDVRIAPANRERTGLGADDCFYWTCQSLSKYLPQHDSIFPRIALANPKAKFVFIEYSAGARPTEIFRARLGKAFAGFGLDFRRHCLFLPSMSQEEFLSVSAAADVFLDSIGWSGCNTCMEGLAFNLPVVTMPGVAMRANHSSAILKMMGLEELIAADLDDYVRKSVRLGLDKDHRRNVSGMIAAGKERVYRDMECIYGLEEFLVRAVGEKTAGSSKTKIHPANA